MSKKFIAKAIKKPGALHKELGVPKDKKIPEKKLDAAAKKGGKLGERARFAKTLEKMRGRQLMPLGLAQGSIYSIPVLPIMDYTGTQLTYSGVASASSPTSAAVWQITKYNYDGSGNLTSYSFAVSGATNLIWDNRASYSYT